MKEARSSSATGISPDNRSGIVRAFARDRHGDASSEAQGAGLVDDDLDTLDLWIFEGNLRGALRETLDEVEG